MNRPLIAAILLAFLAAPRESGLSADRDGNGFEDADDLAACGRDETPNFLCCGRFPAGQRW